VKKKLNFKKEYAESIVSGRKRTTVRLSTTLRAGDRVEIVAGGISLGTATIESVRVKKLGELTDNDAREDGFTRKEELIRALKDIYRGKGLSASTKVKVIRFRMDSDKQ
jgi:hypothetical protein